MKGTWDFPELSSYADRVICHRINGLVLSALALKDLHTALGETRKRMNREGKNKEGGKEGWTE